MKTHSAQQWSSHARFARRILIGYQGDDVTGAQLERLIDAVSGHAVRQPTGMRHSIGAGIKIAGRPESQLGAFATLMPISLLAATAEQDVLPPADLSPGIDLAIIVNTIELLCTAGLPALYTQVLTMQEFSVWQNYTYLFLYIAAYMLDDTVLVAVVVTTLSHRRLQEREGRWLKLLSGSVILALGLVMLLRPEWLTLGS